MRHDQRGLSVWVGEAELLKAAEVAPPLAPANGWGFALGACGPAPEHAQPGAWHVRGLRLRAGSPTPALIFVNGFSAAPPLLGSHINIEARDRRDNAKYDQRSLLMIDRP